MNALINGLLDQIENLVDSSDRPPAGECAEAIRKVASERNSLVQLDEFLAWFDNDDQGDEGTSDAA